jgi:hypothetical protein
VGDEGEMEEIEGALALKTKFGLRMPKQIRASSRHRGGGANVTMFTAAFLWNGIRTQIHRLV